MQVVEALLNEKLFCQTSPVSDRSNYLSLGKIYVLTCVRLLKWGFISFFRVKL